jgi:hypothetical protein
LFNAPWCPSDKSINTTKMTPSVEQWWVDSTWRKTKWSERNLSSATFVRHKHHMDWPGIEPGSPRWEVGEYPPEPWHGLSLCWNSCECKGFSLYLVENTIRFNYRSELQKGTYKMGTLVCRLSRRYPLRVWLQDSLIMKLRDGAGNRIIVTQQTALNVFTSTLSRWNNCTEPALLSG